MVVKLGGILIDEYFKGRKIQRACILTFNKLQKKLFINSECFCAHPVYYPCHKYFFNEVHVIIMLGLLFN